MDQNKKEDPRPMCPLAGGSFERKKGCDPDYMGIAIIDFRGVYWIGVELRRSLAGGSLEAR